VTKTVFTVKIPEDMKKEMDQYDVNWSDFVRQCLSDKLKRQRMQAASDKLDEIRKRSKPVSTEEIVAWIREDRERLH